MAIDKKQREILDKLDDLNSNINERLKNALPSVKEKVYELINDFTANFKTSNGTFSLNDIVSNLTKLNAFRERLKEIYKESGYISAIKDFTKGFAEVTPLMNDYFGTIVSKFSQDNRLVKLLRNEAVKSATDRLLGGGLEAAIEQPIVDILVDNISNGGSLKQYREQLSEFIKGKDNLGQLDRYVKQITNDSIKEYEGNYISSVTEDLELKWYYYVGTKRKDTRYFCCLRKGNYYRVANVRTWGRKLEWAGEEKNTNSANIKTKVGGYNCHHRFIPVLEDVVPSKFVDSKKPIYNSGCGSRRKKIRIKGRKQLEIAKESEIK